MAVIRTVNGDIAPSDLGVTYMHEHLLTQPPAFLNEPDFVLDSEEAITHELNIFRTAGGRAIVEMSPRDYGRQPEGLRRISQASGVHIVAVTGWVKEKLSKLWVEGRSINQLADEMIREVMEGIDDTGIRAGVLKGGSSLNKITPLEENMLRAAARAHRETGALISTHTEAGTMAVEQVNLLRSEGVEPDRMLIGHLDRCMDWDYHLTLMHMGVTIGYDQLAKQKYYPDDERVKFIVKLVKMGFGKQLAISGDMSRQTYFPSYGRWNGPGFSYILWRFAPWLRSEGVDPADIEQLFVHTPARLLPLDR